MRISIFGLGYVGCVSAACLSSDGHTVVALDVNPNKLATLAAGLSPIQEPGLAPLIAAAVADGFQLPTNIGGTVSSSSLSSL